MQVWNFTPFPLKCSGNLLFIIVWTEPLLHSVLITGQSALHCKLSIQPYNRAISRAVPSHSQCHRRTDTSQKTPQFKWPGKPAAADMSMESTKRGSSPSLPAQNLPCHTYGRCKWQQIVKGWGQSFPPALPTEPASWHKKHQNTFGSRDGGALPPTRLSTETAAGARHHLGTKPAWPARHRAHRHCSARGRHRGRGAAYASARPRREPPRTPAPPRGHPPAPRGPPGWTCPRCPGRWSTPGAAAHRRRGRAAAATGRHRAARPRPRETAVVRGSGDERGRAPWRGLETPWRGAGPPQPSPLSSGGQTRPAPARPRRRRPASAIQISASALRAHRPRALIGRGGRVKGRGPISTRHAPDQWEPPACPEIWARGGVELFGASDAHRPRALPPSWERAGTGSAGASEPPAICIWQPPRGPSAAGGVPCPHLIWPAGEAVTCSWGWSCPSRAALCGVATWARARWVRDGPRALPGSARRAAGGGGREGWGSGQAGEPPAARVFAAAGPEGVPGSPAGRCQAAASALRLPGAGAVAWREGARPGRAEQPPPEGCARGAVPAPAAGAWRPRGGAGGCRSRGCWLVSAWSPPGVPS